LDGASFAAATEDEPDDEKEAEATNHKIEQYLK
jgi:hypothetical protein